jgi:hypothetical protein
MLSLELCFLCFFTHSATSPFPHHVHPVLPSSPLGCYYTLSQSISRQPLTSPPLTRLGALYLPPPSVSLHCTHSLTRRPHVHLSSIYTSLTIAVYASHHILHPAIYRSPHIRPVHSFFSLFFASTFFVQDCTLLADRVVFHLCPSHSRDRPSSSSIYSFSDRRGRPVRAIPSSSFIAPGTAALLLPPL